MEWKEKEKTKVESEKVILTIGVSTVSIHENYLC